MDRYYIDNLDVLILMSGEVLVNENIADINDPGDGEVKRPKRMDKKILRMAKEEKRARELSDRRYRGAKRIITAFLAICTLALGVFLSMTPVRVAIADTVVSWYDENIGWFRDASEKSAPTTIEEKHEPTNVPFEVTKEVMTESSSNYVIEYNLNNGKKLIVYTQTVKLENSSWIDEHVNRVKPVNINGHSGNIYTYKNMELKSIEWSDNEYKYSIFLYDDLISEESLIKIAESVK